MRLPGRVAAVIGILAPVLNGSQVETEVATWSRRNRYAGSSDRSAIRDILYDILRRRDEYAFLGGDLSPRALALGWTRANSHTVDDIFGDDRFAPSAVTDDETCKFGDLCVAKARAWPNMPPWIADLFVEEYGAEARSVFEVLSQRAPTDIRINRAKVSVEHVAAALREDGISFEAIDIEGALRIAPGSRGLSQSASYENGHFEFQDAHSQQLCNSIPLDRVTTVLDFCAGGGGKALALASRRPDLEISAWDINRKRMSDIPGRAARAGSSITVLGRDPSSTEIKYDLVVLDVPCSGSGSWRRDPFGKWSLTEERLSELVHIQAEVLKKAAPLVKIGGRLAYITCSVLKMENEDQIAGFVSGPETWHVRSQSRLHLSGLGDGFFLCILDRQS
ncbi:MAG: RsmB/NOP family class I SAM-dependent RNA methyltransferase [Pseudomonadota bacterium]